MRHFSANPFSYQRACCMTILLLATSGAVAAPLVLVKDVNLGTGNGIQPYIVSLDDKVFFWGYDGSNGTLGNPFVSDGSGPGTTRIRDLMGTSGVFQFFQVPWQIQGAAIFALNDGFSNIQLWRSDGSDAGTFALTNEAGSSGASPSQIIPFGNRAVVNARSSSGCPTGRCLWFTDGMVAGTLVAPPGNFFYSQERFTSLHGNALFTANGIVGQTQPGLFFTDGTTGGTVLVSNTLTNVSAMLPFNTQIVFTPSTAAEGVEPWITDGSSGNALLLANINTGSASSNPGLLARVDDLVYFVALQPATGRELWKTDGTPLGTQLVKDIRAGVQDSSIVTPIAIHGKLYFRADDGINGTEVWVSDGSTAGTQMVKDINPGATGSSPGSMAAVNDRLLFSADDGSGQRLWMSDGTDASTIKLDSTVGLGLTAMAPANGGLYVKGFAPATGNELYRLDLLGGGLPNRWCVRPNFQIRDSTTFTSRFKLPTIGRPLKGVRVVLDITHSFVSDLTVNLTHTETTRSAVLLNRPGGCSGNNVDVIVDDAASAAIQTSCSAGANAYSRDASYRPSAALSAFDGDDLAGTWTLQVQDQAIGDLGTLNEWCLDFDRIFSAGFQ